MPGYIPDQDYLILSGIAHISVVPEATTPKSRKRINYMNSGTTIIETYGKGGESISVAI